MDSTVIVYHDRINVICDSQVVRSEAIPLAEVMAWAADNDIPLVHLNPQGRGRQFIHALTPITPDQQLLVRLRWH